MSDDFGDRMKMFESRETGRFMPLLPIYARLDGKSFSKFTKNFDRPFDVRMQRWMIETTKDLVKKTNAKIGYTQSDEISLVWYSDKIDSQVFFDGKKQKLVSVLASMCTASFIANYLNGVCRSDDDYSQLLGKDLPVFDCRAFQLPSLMEATNCFLWREQDATKNAISMACRHYYSHKEMHGKSGSEMQEMLFQKGINFNDYPAAFKRGTFVQHRTFEKELTREELEKIPEHKRPEGPVIRSKIEEIEMPKFSSVSNRVNVIFNEKEPSKV